MFIRFFKNNNPSNFVLLPLFALALWAGGFIFHPVFTTANSAALFGFLVKSLSSVPFLSTALSFILIITEAFILNYIASENEIITKRTFLPALLYIVIMSNSEQMLTLHPSLIANLFLLLSLNRLITSFRKNSAFPNVFDAGFFLSIATLFYFPSILLFPVIFAGLIIFRSYNWREWLISVIGFAVPSFFVLTYYFWFDGLPEFFNHTKSYFVLHEKPSFDFSSSFYFLMIAGLFIILPSLVKLISSIASGSQKTKKNLIFINWVFVFSFVSFSIVPELSFPNFAVLAIPLSVYAANYFLNMKKELAGEFLFLVFLAAVFLNVYGRFF